MTWPTDRPGVPLHADRDGWHWLKHPEDLRPFPSAWNAELRGWPSGALHSPQGIVDLGFAYLGPCYTQADLDAAVQAERDAGAAMRRDALFFMADEVADLADGGVAGSALLTAVKRIEAGERMPPEGSEEDWPMLRAVLNQMDDAIRARGPTSALAAAKDARHD